MFNIHRPFHFAGLSFIKKNGPTRKIFSIKIYRVWLIRGLLNIDNPLLIPFSKVVAKRQPHKGSMQVYRVQVAFWQSSFSCLELKQDSLEKRTKPKSKIKYGKEKYIHLQPKLILTLIQQHSVIYRRKQSKIIIQNPKTFALSIFQDIQLLFNFLSLEKVPIFQISKRNKMFHLDFYEDQENSLDILIKFRDEQQQPQSHTHQQCFLPLTEISVTSDHPSASPHLSPQPIHNQDIITEQLIRKMQVACHSQEQKVNEILKKMDGIKPSSSSVFMRKKRGESFQELDQQIPSKRKIIHKMKSE